MSRGGGLTGLFARSGDNGRSPGRRVSFAPKAKIREFQEQLHDRNKNRDQGPDSGWEFEIPDLYSVRRMSQISELRVSLGGGTSGESYEMDLKTSSPYDVAAMSSSSSNKDNPYKSELVPDAKASPIIQEARLNDGFEEEMEAMKEMNITDMKTFRVESIPQTPKLDKNDSVAEFFVNTRSQPIDIVVSPTLAFSGIDYDSHKDGKSTLDTSKLSPSTPKMRKSPSDMSIQLDLDSPQNSLQKLPRFPQSYAPSYPHKETVEPYVTQKGDDAPKAKSSPSMQKDASSPNFYRGYTTRSLGYTNPPTPTKLRVPSTPTLDLRTIPKQSPAIYNLNPPDSLPLEFDDHQWSPQSSKKTSQISERKVVASSSASNSADPLRRDVQNSSEKTLRDDFFDQFTNIGEDIMHERLPSYDTTVQGRSNLKDVTSNGCSFKMDTSFRSPLHKRSVNLESLLKSVNIDLSDEFPYAFNKKETFYYLPKTLECCSMEKLVLFMLPKLSYTENECLKLQDIIAKTRFNVSRLIREVEHNPPPIFYEIQDHNNREAREVREALKTTHVFSVNEAEANVYLRHSDSVNAFHRSMAQVLPSLQSDEYKIKNHLSEFTKKLRKVKEFNETIKAAIKDTKKKIEERKLEQESRRTELSKLCNSKHDYLRSLMEKNVSSQQNINDSSEIDKLKTELKHVQSCINDIDKKYGKVRLLSTNRLRALGRNYDLVHITLPWRIVSSEKIQITFSYMGVILLQVTRDVVSNTCKIKIQLADSRKGTSNIADWDGDNWIMISTLGAENVSAVLAQVEADMFPFPVPAREVNRAMMVVEVLWNCLQQLYFDFELVRSRFDASLVLSHKNSLGIKVNYFSQQKKTRAELIFWRVLHLYERTGPHHDLNVEHGSELNADEISSRISQLESKLGQNPSIIDLIEGVYME